MIEITRTLDSTHTKLSYVKGSLKNVSVIRNGIDGHGFIFSLINPPVPLGGNIVSLDVYVDDLPVPRKSIFVSTSEEVVNASMLCESRPLPFKPYQSARFLILKNGGLSRNGNGKKHKIAIMSRLEGFDDITIPFTFKDRISDDEKERIVIPSNDNVVSYPESENGETIFKNFNTPLILSGKKAYIVCSSNGSLSANWTWMGIRYDNGGLYVPPARAFGRVVVEISIDDGVRKRLPSFVVSSKHEHGVLYTVHDLAGLRVKRRLTVPAENKGFIMEMEMELLTDGRSTNDALGKLGPASGKGAPVRISNGGGKKKAKRKVRVDFLIDGNLTSYGLAAVSQNVTSKFDHNHNCLQISSAAAKGKEKNRESVHYFGTIGIAPKNIRPRSFVMDSINNDMEMSYDVEVEEGSPIKLALVGTGSFSSADECLTEFLFMRDNYESLLQDTKEAFRQFSASTLSMAKSTTSNEIIKLSNLPKLARSFEKAKTAMQYLKGEYEGLGEGICAGLPRFPNYWARDTGWSLRGYLSIGDSGFARSTIDNFLRHQARRTTDCAVAGELPMLISGKAFLHATTYGSADSTFLFPWAIREYVLSTGDIEYLRKRWNSIVRLVDCGLLKDIDGDGFIDHGFTGTAEKLPIQDSTWMDHIDRRKSANDVQALFYESLVVGSELAEMVDDSYNKTRWSQKAEELRSRIDREFWSNKEGFYYDTIRKDGSRDLCIRPNSLVILLTNSVKSKGQAEKVLERIEREDMTTKWGVRTLSNKDPKYNPASYHNGAVWPLVTAWAALSQLKFGRKRQAFHYVNMMAERLMAENGMYAETYRGDRPEPFNSCILQAWSVGLFVHALSELMLGMKTNMVENKIYFEPQIDEESLNIGLSRDPITFDQTVKATDARGGSFKVAIDPYHRKISVVLKHWKGSKPEFVCGASYGISVN